MAWKEVERLVSEQKFQAAVEVVAAIRGEARQKNDVENWTRALVEEVQLRTGLHGYETSVRFLMEQDWPDEATARAILDLYYASSLMTYNQAYSWEIRKRERMVSEDEVDLKAWTAAQIVEQANLAYQRVWDQRSEWGGESLGALARYIDQNSYPARIRGTLRDAVSYMWVELLADSSLWRPEQSNQIFRLDRATLITGDVAASAALDLGDPQLHPLLKVGAVLDDLESWHAAGDRDEAALEARLERLRRLHDAFTNDDDKVAVRSHLEQRLSDFDSGLDWWAVGQATVAELIRSEDDRDSLVRARAAALAGADRHPDSLGGQRCRHIMASIEAPSFRVEAMAVDGPGRRSLRVNHRNMDSLYLRAYPVDLLRQVESAEDSNLIPGHREVERIMQSQEPMVEWAVELPETPDYRDHHTYDNPPLTAPGAYLLVASARRGFFDSGNQRVGLFFVVSDLVLLRRQVEDTIEVTVRSGASGRPVGDVELRLYEFNWRHGHRRVSTMSTADNGMARFPVAGMKRQQHFIVARKGAHLALDQRYIYPERKAEPSIDTAALLYTDRSVYRPQQTLHFKAVAYAGDGDDASFNTLPGSRLTVTLLDANHEEVASQDLTTNHFGSVSGSFEIPAGRLLGEWRLSASIGGQTEIRVEEYKRPTFEVTVSDPEAPLRLNRPAELAGEAKYYFGLPVTGGSVAWQVRREPVYPPWWFWWRPEPAAAQIIASGEETLDDEGQFAVHFTPSADEREAKKPGMSYRYRLSVDVTDEGGETRSASRAFRLGFVSVEAKVTSEQRFTRTGEALELSVVRSDLNGVPRPGAGSWRLLALEQPRETLLPADQPMPRPPDGEEEGYATPGDALRPRWRPDYQPETVLAAWPDERQITSGSIEHGDDGLATFTLDSLDPGAYRLRYETTDDFGATCTASSELLVAGHETTPLALPSLLVAERPSVPVGETARLLVRSGLEKQEMVLEVFVAGQRRSRRVLEAGDDRELIEIPVTDDLRGGFGVSLSLVRDHQLMRHTETIFVPWDNKELELDFATFRDTLRPGSDETFTITLRGADGEAVEAGTAEVLAYMYDRSLDIFAPHNPPSPLSLYPKRTGVGSLTSTLGSARVVWRSDGGFVSLPGYPYLSGDRLKHLDRYGIGGPGRRRGMHGHRPRLAMAMKSAAPQEGAMMAAEAEAPLADSAGRSMEEEITVSGALDDMTGGEAPPEEPVELRSDFSETAFFEPHLLTGDDGSATIEFTVPDSVTEWNLWLHAITTDLRGGSLRKQPRSVKELMVRPYLPRFLREGDRAEIKVVVNNAGEHELEGVLDLEVFDPDTGEDLRPAFGLDEASTTGVPFVVAAGGGADLAFGIAVPPRVGTVAFRITARAGDFSDGELRPLPVLPGRMHLVQSRFVALSDADRRKMHFADLAADDDPSRIDDQLVVTVDAQLFYSVLSALPYLVNYPYECTEQTLNRFLSTGILTSLYDTYPSVARMADKLSTRDTRLETWDAADPNRRMALEETPWLVQSKGGDEQPQDLLNVLDPRIAVAERRSALAKLEKSQTSLGAFPWWPGGPPSPYMTLYILCGFSKGLEFGVDVPRDVVVRAWAYMHRHYTDQWVPRMMQEDWSWESITFLNYVLSNYPDESWTGGLFTADDRKNMLEHSFRHWKQHSPLLKGYLALTLERAGRHDDARLVFDSVMDSARSDRDLGTYWAPEERAWLWYNDTIETHAFALRTLSELEPDDGRRQGLVHWLFLNKKLNHWKSTRATAEVVYSLTHYLKQEGALGVREDATVTVGSREARFVFEPDEYTGARNRLVIAGDDIDPATMATVVVEKQSKGIAFASATWHFSTEKLPEEARGDLFAVTRRYFRRATVGDEVQLVPLEEGAHLEAGDQVEVHLSLSAKHAAEYVHLRDPRGAGFEPESIRSRYRWDLGIAAYEEIRDSGSNFFIEWLPAGEYTFTYRLRANMAGSFKVGPATLQSMYAPEFAAYSAGHRLEIGK